MTTHATRQSDALILAVDESSLAVGGELIRLASAVTGSDAGAIDWPMLVVNGAGDALRQIHHVEPGALFMCVAQIRLEQAAAVIDAVRQRRPRLPQLAIASVHDEEIERAVRTAGAAYYFALGTPADEALLRHTLDALGVLPVATSSHSGLSPPREPRALRPRLTDDPISNR
jgi:hypothetical protein